MLELEGFLSRTESKTLEFKENTKALDAIIKTIISFANTAGGTIIIGIKNGIKKVVGVADVLAEERKVTNAITDSIEPFIVPDIEIRTYRNKELILIHVPHLAGPYFLKSKGIEKGVYVRLGSTNRQADDEMLSVLRLFAMNRTFDELPQPMGIFDSALAKEVFKWVHKHPTEKAFETLGIFTHHSGKTCLTVGGLLLFGKNRLEIFPDARIQCARFLGEDKEKILDQKEISVSLPFAIEEVLKFIERHTQTKADIGRVLRKDILEYPPFALRESIVNAILHTDYSMKGCTIQVAIFNDRIEFTNPGGLPLGQTIEKAIAGFSRLRNRVIGRVFRELKLIEQWGSGIQRILGVCKSSGLQTPLIEEHNNQFRVTLFSKKVKAPDLNSWEEKVVGYLHRKDFITPKEAANLWSVSDKTARKRLRKLTAEGKVKRIATSETDPYSKYILSGGFS